MSGKPGKTQPTYTFRFRANAVRLFERHDKSLRKVAAGLGLPAESLRRWVLQARIDIGKATDGALTMEEREELRRFRERMPRYQAVVSQSLAAHVNGHGATAYAQQITEARDHVGVPVEPLLQRGPHGLDGVAVRADAGEHQEVAFACAAQDWRSPNLKVLILGGPPIREPVVFYGSFVMTTQKEGYQVVQDYQDGRMGTIPATILTPSGTAEGA